MALKGEGGIYKDPGNKGVYGADVERILYAITIILLLSVAGRMNQYEWLDIGISFLTLCSAAAIAYYAYRITKQGKMHEHHSTLKGTVLEPLSRISLHYDWRNKKLAVVAYTKAEDGLQYIPYKSLSDYQEFKEHLGARKYKKLRRKINELDVAIKEFNQRLFHGIQKEVTPHIRNYLRTHQSIDFRSIQVFYAMCHLTIQGPKQDFATYLMTGQHNKKYRLTFEQGQSVYFVLGQSPNKIDQQRAEPPLNGLMTLQEIQTYLHEVIENDKNIKGMIKSIRGDVNSIIAHIEKGGNLEGKCYVEKKII